jgi:hypothetical protein
LRSSMVGNVIISRERDNSQDDFWQRTFGSIIVSVDIYERGVCIHTFLCHTMNILTLAEVLTGHI